MQYWNSTNECMPRDKMTEVQTERLIRRLRGFITMYPFTVTKCKKLVLNSAT
jgi:phenylacetate-CoA ligase